MKSIFKTISNLGKFQPKKLNLNQQYQKLKVNTVQVLNYSNKFKYQSNIRWLGIIGFMTLIKYKIDEKNRYMCTSNQQYTNGNAKDYFDSKLTWHFRKMSNQNYQNVVLIAGNSNPKLAQDIANFLGIPLTDLQIQQHKDGEINIKCEDEDALRGKHVFIIQSTCKPVNDNIVEVALLSGWLKRQSVKQVTLVMPYYGYSRHKKNRNLSSDASRLLQTMAIDRFVTLDIHAGQILGYYGPDVMFENLEASIVPLNYFLNLYEEKREDFVIISPDADGVGRAKQFCDLFNQKGGANCSMGIILKYAQNTNSDVEQFQLIGDVKDKNVIIIDDLVDTASTLCSTVKALKKEGAKKVYAYATHSLLTGEAFKNIQESGVNRFITTDTIPAQPEEAQSKQIIRLTIAPLLAEALRRIEHKMSLESLTGISYDRKHQHMSNKEYTR